MRSVTLLALLAVVGCGAASGRSSGDGGAADMAVATGPEANPPKLAQVTLNSIFSSTFGSATAIGEFSTYAGSVTGPCSDAAAGSCRVRSCPTANDLGSAVEPGPTRTFVSAGTVTLDGPAGSMMLMSTGMSYSLSLGGAKPWNGGETFTVSATGADVPAFMLSLSAPSRPAITSPPKSGTAVAVSRAAGLPITWTPSSPGTMAFDVAAHTAGTYIDVECDTATSSGSYTIGSDALAAIPADATDISVSARVTTSTSTMAGDWPVTFLAQAIVDDAALDGAWSYLVTLN